MIRQACCVPLREGPAGREVLLVTSRYTGEWILPKGRIDAGESAAVAARREAVEEAGVQGEIGRSLGVFDTRRGLKPASIEGFVLHVHRELSSWPECHERRRRWVTLAEALTIVRRPPFRAMLQELLQPRHASVRARD